MADMGTILLPHGEQEGRDSRLAPRLKSLERKRVGFINNELWRSMHILQDELAKVFTSEYGVVDPETVYVGPQKGADPKQYLAELEGLTKRVDAVVSGLGN